MIQVISYQGEGGLARTGLLHAERIYASNRFETTLQVLDAWASADAKLETLARQLPERKALAGVCLAAPLPEPRNIYFAGANYRDHVLEMRARLGLPLEPDPKGQGQRPWHSLKSTGSTVVGPSAQVSLPGGTAMLDWELELAVVIGQRCKDVPLEQAYDVVAGYIVANDLSARDHVQRANVEAGSPFKWDWIGQKSFDGSCPMGPAMTPHRYIGDPMQLAMKLWVNGELMQDSNTREMLFDIRDQIAHLSSRVTLLPGDLILTGTPAGVGMARNRFLRSGDVVRQWIENIGEFEFGIR